MKLHFVDNDGHWTISGPVRPSYITGLRGVPDRLIELASAVDDRWAANFDFDRFHEPEDEIAYILEAQVSEVYRNRGIGTKMTIRLMDELEGKDVVGVHLKSMDTSIRFWDRLGFEIVERDGLGAHMFRTL